MVDILANRFFETGWRSIEFVGEHEGASQQTRFLCPQCNSQVLGCDGERRPFLRNVESFLDEIYDASLPFFGTYNPTE